MNGNTCAIQTEGKEMIQQFVHSRDMYCILQQYDQENMQEKIQVGTNKSYICAYRAENQSQSTHMKTTAL